MAPEQRDRLRRREKEAAYLRAAGRPLSVDPAPAIRHAQRLNSRGMSAQEIAILAGVSKSVVNDYIRGTRTSDRGGHPLKMAPRRVAEGILSVRFHPPADRGANVDGTGLRRRLQALARLGFSGPFLGSQLDLTHRRVHQLTAYDTTVLLGSSDRVARLYGKLSETRPEDFGVGQASIVRARNAAIRNGYAPPSCWDPDTIDDPEAIPEWTGVCGTPEGLRIHYRDQILPACRACLDTRTVETPHAGSSTSDFRGAKLTRIRELRGMSIKGLAHRLGVNGGTVYYWETGRSSPRSRARLEQLCAVLGCNEIDLIEDE